MSRSSHCSADDARPLLITGFEPDLDQPEVLARQVHMLEEQIDKERGTVVLLAQSSYGGLIRRREQMQRHGELVPSSPLHRLTNLLAQFSVYHGHDTDLAENWRERTPRADAYENAFAVEPLPPAPAMGLWTRLKPRQRFLRRRRCLFDVLYREGKPTRQLQRIALRLIETPENDACTAEQIVSQMGIAAGPYYEAIWASCDVEERIVLAQLAWEGVANPKAYETILDLLHKGLIYRDPALRLMNRSFEKFVRRALPRWQLVELEEEAGTSAWSILKWLLPLPLLLLGGFLFLTQQDAMSNVIGLLIAGASLIPTFVNLYQQFQQLSVQRSHEPDG